MLVLGAVFCHQVASGDLTERVSLPFTNPDNQHSIERVPNDRSPCPPGIGPEPSQMCRCLSLNAEKAWAWVGFVARALRRASSDLCGGRDLACTHFVPLS